MANVVRLKRGLSLQLEGAALPNVEKTVVSDTVAIVPDNFHGIVPKVVVKPGDAVKVGSVVMYDKITPRCNLFLP